VITLGIVHQESRVYLEKLRQQGAGRLRHVAARTVLDLRDIRLADALALILADRLDQLQLRHGAAYFAERAFHFPQVANFLGQGHITDRYIYIANCNAVSRAECDVFCCN